MEQKNKSSLSFSGIELKFIYSFLIDFNDFGEFVSHLTDRKWGEEKKYKIEPHDIRDRQLASTVKISRVIKLIDGSEVHCVLISKEWDNKDIYQVLSDNNNTAEDLNILITTSGRIHDSGMGTFSITLKNAGARKRFNISDFNLLFRLVERVSDGNNFVFLKKISDSENSKFRLDLLFKIYMNGLKDQLTNIDGSQNIKFVDEEETFDDSNKDSFSQIPYVITIGELQQEQYENIFIGEDRIEDNIRNEISLLLLRVINISNENEIRLEPKDLANINLQYIKSYFEFDEKKNIPVNLAMDKRMYYQFHPRSCLILTPNAELAPASFLIPSIQNTLEITRTRWYSGIIINSILDSAIHKLRDKYNPTETDFLEEIITIKKLYSQLLENPVIYGFEGGSVTAIAKIAEKKMWLQEIIDLTSAKMRIIDQIYEGQKAAYYARKSKELAEKGRKIYGSDSSK